MDISQKFLIFVADLLFPLAIGYWCKQNKRFNEAFFSRMITLNVLVLYPILSVLSFWVMHLNSELIWLPFLGIFTSIIAGLIAYPRARAKYASGLDQGSYILSAILSNQLTLGGLCVFIMYGETGFAYVQLIVLFYNLVTFLFCYPLAQYYRQRNSLDGPGLSLKAILLNRNQLPVLGVFVGIFLYASGLSRPPWANEIFDPLVHIAAWTALIPVGYSAVFTEMKKYWRDMIDLSFIKFLVTPICTLLLGKLFIQDPIVLNTLVVVASTPTAINAVITVRLHDLNIHIAMAAFVLTTALFLFIVYPSLFFLMLH